ncbi:MAG TPA: hypothetical protein VN802_16460 [Stellaceae bacterium]|nr:hypothetical protein [Stellaceae bacterium]
MPPPNDPPPPHKKPAALRREDRLAAALRANLGRRKAQARVRGEPKPAPKSSGCE